MINAESIYNLVLLCFKVRYQKRTTRGRADFKFLLLTLKPSGREAMSLQAGYIVLEKGDP